MGRMDGKVAVVTGAGSGIGKGIALMFAKEGAQVVLACRGKAAGNATLDQIREEGGDAIFVSTDVNDKESIKALHEAALAKYGKITTLVNAAGILVHKPFLEHTDEDLEKVYNTNFRGYFWMMQEFLPSLVEYGHSSVLNIASISVQKPETYAYMYGAMKAGVDILTRNLIREFSLQGVRFNVICPGPVKTNMTPKEVMNDPEIQAQMGRDVCPVGRLGEPEDIAYAAVWLCSEEGSWVNGSKVIIDGGACMMG